MADDPTPAAPAEGGATDLRSVHTVSLPELLDRLGITVLVSTYQAGKLIAVRAEGGKANTHFRAFQAPMGLALDGDRLAVGTTIQVWEFANVPAVARKLDPPGRHDACFLPRASHVTGNIQVHEMAWRRRRAVGRQHPVLLPLHARPLGQLRRRGGGRRSSRRWSRPTAAT